jgi:hypothetical protein
MVWHTTITPNVGDVEVAPSHRFVRLVACRVTPEFHVFGGMRVNAID